MKLIIACDPKGGIGFNGKLPWTNLQGDLLRFKELTTGKVILMGRNTWESLPKKPLPNRINVVVSSNTISKMDFKDKNIGDGSAIDNISNKLVNNKDLRVKLDNLCKNKFFLKIIQNLNNYKTN